MTLLLGLCLTISSRNRAFHSENNKHNTGTTTVISCAAIEGNTTVISSGVIEGNTTVICGMIESNTTVVIIIIWGD